MTIYPAIDLKQGKCVRLVQGRADREKVYSEDPAAVAEGFRAQGADWIHVVDLDGAFEGEPRNLAVVAAIVKTGLKVQYGGGLRSAAVVEQVLGLGVTRAVIGTRAAEDRSFVQDLVRAHGPRIAVGIDAKDGKVATKGWVNISTLEAVEFAGQMESAGVQTFIYTDIGTDGMLRGPNLAAQAEMAGSIRARLISSGGVSSLDDIHQLRRLASAHANLEGAIVGKALYEGRFSVAAAFEAARPD